GVRDAPVRRHWLGGAVDRDRVTGGTDVHASGVVRDDQAAHRRTPYVVHRGRRPGGADGDVPGVVSVIDAVDRDRHQAVRGHHDERHFVVTTREPVENGDTVGGGRLTEGVVHPDLIDR